MYKQTPEYLREWRKNNPGKTAEYLRRYKERHPERVAAQRAAVKAKYIKKGRYRVSDEHKRLVDRKNEKIWRTKNPERVKAKQRRSYLKHKALYQLHGRNYKAKLDRKSSVGAPTMQSN